jgi:hypothetical protein
MICGMLADYTQHCLWAEIVYKGVGSLLKQQLPNLLDVVLPLPSYITSP